MRPLTAIVLLATSVLPATLTGQQPVRTSARTSPAAADTAAVRAVIVGMFDAMRAVDTAAMRAAFVPGAMLVSVGDSAGMARVDTTSLDDFLGGLARAKARNPQLVPDERLGRMAIEIDGPLAAVWTDYELWVNDRFSHCGVDAFHLIRTSAGWRILQLADTRRREGCEGG